MQKKRAFDHSKYQLWIDPNEVVPYEKNAKIHTDKQVKNIVNSIKRFGWQQDTVLTKDNVLVIGHGRRLAALEIGCEMPYHVIDKNADELTDEDIRELRIADNQTNAETGFDFSALAEDIDGLDFEGFDFDFGIDTEEQDEEPIEIVEDEPPTETETRCKVGDLWQMGEHRLICGDSTDVAVIDRLMDGVKADMVFTDPPYGMKKESEGVLNDNLNYDDLLDFNRQWIPLTFGALKDNGSWYCWGIDEPLMDIYSNILKPMAKENKITFRNLITWDKGNGQGQLSEDFRMYPVADEKCLFVMMGVQGADGILDASETLGVYLKYMTEELQKSGLTEKDLNEICGYKSIAQHWTLNRDGTQKQPRLIQKDDYQKIQKFCRGNGNDAFKKEYDEIKKEYDEIKKEYDEIKKEWYETRAYFDNTHDNQNNVWHFDRAGKDEREHTGGHATPKPIALCSRAIKSSSREGEIVLDVFGGSGSTLIACEQLNRKCYMAELDERYVSVIVNRWLKFTGRKDEIFCIRDGQKLTYDEVFKQDRSKDL